MIELFANSGDPDQMPHFRASDLGLQCLPNILLGVSRCQWVKVWRFSYFSIATDKSGYPHNIFLISPRKHMLWVLIRSALLRRF